MAAPVFAQNDGPEIDLPDDEVTNADTLLIEPTYGTTLGGYGEFEYTDVEGPGGRSFDFHRFVLFISHDFNDWISLVSETEIEHAEKIEMEQAYLEFRLPHNLALRGGLILTPVGLTNLNHEPTFYHGAIRPRMDKVILPTTWREAAVGALWSPIDGLTVEAYVMSGLNATGFSASSGIRGGRQAVSKAAGNDLAFAGRVTYEPILGLSLGLSGYFGNSGQGEAGGLDVPVMIVEFDTRYRNHGLEARLQTALVGIGDAAELSDNLGEAIGSQLFGAFVEVAYDVFDVLECDQQLLPFVRYEMTNTQFDLDESLEATPELDRSDIIFGLTYRPINQISIKFDYQLTSSDGEDPDDQWDLGIGWMF